MKTEMEWKLKWNESRNGMKAELDESWNRMKARMEWNFKWNENLNGIALTKMDIMDIKLIGRK